MNMANVIFIFNLVLGFSVFPSFDQAMAMAINIILQLLYISGGDFFFV
jgi:hypothetical protein